MEHRPDPSLASVLSWTVWTATRIGLGLLVLVGVWVAAFLASDSLLPPAQSQEFESALEAYQRFGCPPAMSPDDLRRVASGTLYAPSAGAGVPATAGAEVTPAQARACIPLGDRVVWAFQFNSSREIERSRTMKRTAWVASVLALVAWSAWYQRARRKALAKRGAGAAAGPP